MAKITDIYGIVKASREHIIKTMQERGLTEVVIMPDREEWLKQNPDKYEEDYDKACYDECPYVVYFDKYGCGYDYMVKKVELIGKDALGFPCFRMECEANELGYDRFTDDDVYDMRWVYEVLEKRLGIDDEPEYVYVFTAEQAYDEKTYDTIVKAFSSEEAAQEFLNTFIHDDGDEPITEYVEKHGWSVENDEPNYYMACEDGNYQANHIECTITKCEIN